MKRYRNWFENTKFDEGVDTNSNGAPINNSQQRRCLFIVEALNSVILFNKTECNYDAVTGVLSPQKILMHIYLPFQKLPTFFTITFVDHRTLLIFDFELYVVEI